MPAPARVSGQRRYPESAVGLVGVILLLRDVGFSLRESKAFLASRTQAVEGWRRLAQRKLAHLDEQIVKAETARKAHTTTSPPAAISPTWSPPALPASLSRKLTNTDLLTNNAVATAELTQPSFRGRRPLLPSALATSLRIGSGTARARRRLQRAVERVVTAVHINERVGKTYSVSLSPDVALNAPTARPIQPAAVQRRVKVRR